jgi:hypothetical protein
MPRIQRKGRGGTGESNSVPNTPEKGIEIPDRNREDEGGDHGQGGLQGNRGPRRKRGGEGGEERNESKGQEKEKLITQSSIPKISTRLMFAQRGAIDVQKEDLDEQNLSYDDIADFVSVSFGDQTDGFIDHSKINWDYSAERRGTMVLLLSSRLTVSTQQEATFYLSRIRKLAF